MTLADSVETLGVDLRTRVKKVGCKRKSEEEEVQGEVLTQKRRIKQGQEAVTCRYDASKDLVSPCSGDVSHGEVRIEDTNGGSCGQKEYDLPFFVYGSIRL